MPRLCEVYGYGMGTGYIPCTRSHTQMPCKIGVQNFFSQWVQDYDKNSSFTVFLLPFLIKKHNFSESVGLSTPVDFGQNLTKSGFAEFHRILLIVLFFPLLIPNLTIKVHEIAGNIIKIDKTSQLKSMFLAIFNVIRPTTKNCLF